MEQCPSKSRVQHPQNQGLGRGVRGDAGAALEWKYPEACFRLCWRQGKTSGCETRCAWWRENWLGCATRTACVCVCLVWENVARGGCLSRSGMETGCVRVGRWDGVSTRVGTGDRERKSACGSLEQLHAGVTAATPCFPGSAERHRVRGVHRPALGILPPFAAPWGARLQAKLFWSGKARKGFSGSDFCWRVQFC